MNRIVLSNYFWARRISRILSNIKDGALSKKLTGFSTYFRKKTTSELFDRVPNKSLIREKSENSLSIFAAELVIRKEKHFKSFLQRFSD